MDGSGYVDVVTGLMGGGKSYAVLCLYILPHLMKGGLVVTNIKLEIEPWHSDRYRRKYLGLRALLAAKGREFIPEQIRYVTSEEMAQIHKTIPGGTVELPVLLVIDEALDIFSVDERGDRGLKDVLSWIRHIRKLGVSIVVICQTFSELNNRIRSKCRQLITCQDGASLRVAGIPFPLPWWSPLFRVLYWDRTGKTVLRRKSLTKNPEIFGCYRTEQLFSALEHSAESWAGVDNRISRGKKMTRFERMMLLLSLGLGLVSAGRSWWPSGAHAVERVGVSSVVQAGLGGAPPRPVETVSNPLVVGVEGLSSWGSVDWPTIGIGRETYEPGDVVFLSGAWYKLGGTSARGVVAFDGAGQRVELRAVSAAVPVSTNSLTSG